MLMHRQSLVKSILRRQHLSTEAMRWGIDNELGQWQGTCIALQWWRITILHSTGLYINPQCPHLGASPDGLSSCTCCGGGVLEIIKCPYSIRDQDPTQVQQADFYLKPQDEGGVKLNKKRNYCYQVQGQLMVCNLPIVTSQHGHRRAYILNYRKDCHVLSSSRTLLYSNSSIDCLVYVLVVVHHCSLQVQEQLH